MPKTDMNVQMKSNPNMKRILFLCLAALSLVGTDAFAQYQTVRAFSHRGGRLENDRFRDRYPHDQGRRADYHARPDP